MANKLRNEVSVTLAGKTILLRPTFGCLLEIESRTGKSTMQLVRQIENAELSMADTLVIFEEATKAAENPLTRQEVVDLVELEGIVDVQTATVNFFIQALYPGTKNPNSKKKAALTAI